MAYSSGFSQSLEILFYIELKNMKEEEKYLTIQQISEKLNIPVPSVKRLIGLLKKSGLIDSKKGVNGGLALGKPAKEIRIYDVFRAVEGNGPLFKRHNNFDTDSLVHKKEARHMLTNSKKIFDDAEQAMVNELKSKTLLDLF